MRHNGRNNKLTAKLLSAVFAIALVGGTLAYQGFVAPDFWQEDVAAASQEVGAHSVTADNLPKYNGDASVTVNGNIPEFTESDKKRTDAFERYSKLDSLGRCGVAYANICKELMPKEERGDISDIHPSGWHSGVGFERCHLIGFQLAGENANSRNLITGTGTFNRAGMLPYENEIADYVKRTNNHVLYRVSPVFVADELVARGVQMEAWSVEDNGRGVCFNVYCFNVFKGNRPEIDYLTGKVASLSQQYISIGTLSKTFKVKSKLTSSKSFSMNVSSDTGKITCSKYSGSKYLSVSKAGKVTVKKGAPIGKYQMKVKIFSDGNAIYKSKTIYKTVTVTIKKSSSGSGSSSGGSSGGSGSSGSVSGGSSGGGSKVYWTSSGSCYHSTRNCRTLARSTTILSGSISKAKSLSLRACKVC